MIQKKERMLLVVLLVGILAAGSVYLYGGKPNVQAVAKSEVKSDAQVPQGAAVVATGTQQMIKVHVKGEVNQPGVYQLPADSRMVDAIQAAGGAKAGVDLQKMNLAAMLVDGGEVVVSDRGDQQKAEATQQVDGKLHLNTATAEELDKLPGIGMTRAQAIVEYRTSHGRFLQVEDLKNVPGFGAKLLEQIKDRVTAE